MYKKMDWLFKQTVLTSEVGACCSAVCRIQLCTWIKIINDKARHNLMDVKCKWRSNRLDSAVSFKELLGQTKVMQICQRKTPNHHEICCLSCRQSTSLQSVKGCVIFIKMFRLVCLCCRSAVKVSKIKTNLKISSSEIKTLRKIIKI